MARVLVAGGSGLVGREVIAQLLAEGHTVRALSHKTALPSSLPLEPASWSRLDEAMRDVEVIISSAGASVGMSLRGRAGFDRVDVPIHEALIGAAERAGVAKMVYVSVAAADRLGHTRYVAAHEAVVERLRASGITSSVVRPTGIFGAFGPFLTLVRMRAVPNFGGGRPRTNPVHERDVAAACVRAAFEDVDEVSIGGPDVYTRGEILELAMEAARVRALKIPVPVWVLSANAWLTSLVHPRIGQFMQFMAAIASEDTLAPPLGEHHLADYFARMCSAA